MADEVQVAKKDKKQLQMEKKAEKKRRKEEKQNSRAAKKQAKKDAADAGEEKEGNKLAVVAVTIIIILVWLAILALLIKLDFGGFGSTVLKPILKDVPYINKILPETAEDNIEADPDYPYATLDDAIAQIKSLELQLQEAQESNSSDSDQVKSLKAEIDRLSVFEKNQTEFEALKEQFYEEVVFNDKAPDIKEYKKYYEGIDPDNAQALYKQVVAKVAYSEEVKEYSKTYADMKPKQAAAILEQMTDNLELVSQILKNMDTEPRANILGAMKSDIAAKVTKIMQP